MKNLIAWNNALIAKTLWKIHMKKDSLWIKWISHFYSHFGTVRDWGWHEDETPLIKQIIWIRDEMVRRLGSVEDPMTYLESWFGGNRG